MATLVQSPTMALGSGTPTNLSLAFASNVTSGNMLIAVMSNASTQTVLHVRDSLSGAVDWTAVFPASGPGSKDSQIFYKVAGATGACTVTCTFNGAANAPLLDIFEVSGVDTLRQHIQTGGSSTTTATFPSMTPTSGAFCVLMYRVSGPTISSYPSGWTSDSGGTMGGASAYKIPTDTTALTPSFTQSPAGDWTGVMGEFYLAPPPVTVPNVVGLSKATAEATIVAAGLVVGTETNGFSATIPVGVVISQNPIGGSSLPGGSSVALVISLGQYSYPGEVIYDGNQCVVVNSGDTANTGNAWDASGCYTSWGTGVLVGGTSYLGVDCGIAIYPTAVRISSRGNYEDRLIGGKFQASNASDFSSGVVDLFTISVRPASGGLPNNLFNEYDLTALNSNTFRYLRFLAPFASTRVGDLQFLGTYVTGATGRVAEPTASPPGWHNAYPTRVTLSSRTHGAVIYYTLDGTTPTSSSLLYTGPIVIKTTSTLQAIGILSPLANSNVTSYDFYVANEWVTANVQYDCTRNYKLWRIATRNVFDPSNNYYYITGYNFDNPDGYSYQLPYNLYRTADFLNWEYVGGLNGLDNPAGQLDGAHSFRAETNFIYNALNKNYIAWQRSFGGGVQGPVQSFSAPAIGGPYTQVNSYDNAYSGVTNSGIPVTSTAGAPGTLARTDGGSWITDGILSGYSVNLTGTTGGADDGMHTVTSVGATNLNLSNITVTGSETVNVAIYLNFKAVGDMTVFVDNDGTGYVSKTIQNTHWAIFKLTPDYLAIEGTVAWHFTGLWASPNHESWSLVNNGQGNIVMMYSGLTNWATNLNHYITANSPLAPSNSWSAELNPFVAHSNPSDTNSYNTQVYHFIQIPGRNATFYVGDRFKSDGTDVTGIPWFVDAKAIYLPLTFPTATTMRIPWVDSWNIDTVFPTVSGAPLAASGLSVFGRTITWTNNEPKAYNLYVDRADDAGMSVNVVSQVLSKGTTLFTDTAAVAGNTYFYRVRTVNINGTVNSPVQQLTITLVNAPFTGSILADTGTVGTFYIQVQYTPAGGAYSGNRWKAICPWGYAQAYDVTEAIRQMVHKGGNPMRDWLATGKSDWFSPPTVQTAPDPSHEVGSK